MMKTIQQRRRVIIVAFSLLSSGSGGAMLATLGSAVPRELSVARLLFSADLAGFTLVCLAQVIVGVVLTVLAVLADLTSRVVSVASALASITSLATIGVAVFGNHYVSPPVPMETSFAGFTGRP